MERQPYRELFTRYSGNPIIQGTDMPYPVNGVFNPGATVFEGETLLLMRVEDRQGISHLAVARSRDGFSDWRIDPVPALVSDPSNYPQETWGIEDPRITFLEHEKIWAVAYTGYSKAGPMVCLATTKDFKHFERIGSVMPPENKDAALFPVQFDGRWAMLHRPVSTFTGVGTHIWLSFSPDLRHWGDHQLLLRARTGGWWDADKIGLSPPPLRTEQGWLVMYHGVKTTAGGCIYRVGFALLDLHDPVRVLARSSRWAFSPEADYEVTGDVDKVVFPCGWVRRGDEIRLYYGAADKCVALATARVAEVLSWLRRTQTTGEDAI